MGRQKITEGFKGKDLTELAPQKHLCSVTILNPGKNKQTKRIFVMKQDYADIADYEAQSSNALPFLRTFLHAPISMVDFSYLPKNWIIFIFQLFFSGLPIRFIES